MVKVSGDTKLLKCNERYINGGFCSIPNLGTVEFNDIEYNCTEYCTKY